MKTRVMFSALGVITKQRCRRRDNVIRSETRGLAGLQNIRPQHTLSLLPTSIELRFDQSTTAARGSPQILIKTKMTNALKQKEGLSQRRVFKKMFLLLHITPMLQKCV